MTKITETQARQTPKFRRCSQALSLAYKSKVKSAHKSTSTGSMALSSKRRHLAGIACLGIVMGCTALANQAKALPEAEVIAKLDTVLLLMTVNDKGQPKAVKAKVNGKVVNAYVGAISIAAAEEITAGKRYNLEPTTAKGLRFAPVSLARFNMLLAPLLKAKSNDLGVIAPDPAQVSVAESLLLAQKVPEAKAKQIAALQPMIFCPDPGILVTSNEGPDKGKQFVPCSTEAEFVESIVQRGIKESPKIADTKPKVIAIPLNNFINFLNKESEEKAGPVKVVPSAGMVSLIQKISQQQKPGSKQEGK